jgi:hypothetical protein
LWGALYQHYGAKVAFLGGAAAALAVAVVAFIARNDSRK